MSTSIRSLVSAAFVLCVIVAWHEKTDSDVAVAQSEKTVMVTRIYTGADGLAHAEDIQLARRCSGQQAPNSACVRRHLERVRATPPRRRRTTLAGTSARRGSSS